MVRGRPKNNGIHKVSYYTPSTKTASNALQKVIEERLKKAYVKLFTLSHGDKPDQRDMHKVNLAVKEGLELL